MERIMAERITGINCTPVYYYRAAMSVPYEYEWVDGIMRIPFTVTVMNPEDMNTFFIYENIILSAKDERCVSSLFYNIDGNYHHFPEWYSGMGYKIMSELKVNTSWGVEHTIKDAVIKSIGINIGRQPIKLDVVLEVCISKRIKYSPVGLDDETIKLDAKEIAEDAEINFRDWSKSIPEEKSIPNRFDTEKWEFSFDAKKFALERINQRKKIIEAEEAAKQYVNPFSEFFNSSIRLIKTSTKEEMNEWRSEKDVDKDLSKTFQFGSSGEDWMKRLIELERCYWEYDSKTVEWLEKFHKYITEKGYSVINFK